jgi:hypothetical protein
MAGLERKLYSLKADLVACADLMPISSGQSSQISLFAARAYVGRLEAALSLSAVQK